MKKELNKKSDVVTVVIDVSLKDDIENVKHYIREEQCPLFYSFNDDFIICSRYVFFYMIF